MIGIPPKGSQSDIALQVGMSTRTQGRPATSSDNKGVSTQPKRFLTPEEYLAIERKSPFKHEYLNGETYAMGGAKRAHNLIGVNAGAELRQQLRSKPCELYQNDMRVRTTAGLYAYPDLTVVCGEPQFADGEFDTLLNPSLVIEILSPSTEAYDRSEKFKQYRAIDSLQEYLMIASTRVMADLYLRQPSGWLLRVADTLESQIALESCGCTLKLADVYEKVQFGKTDPFMRPLHPDE
jgi:Uma2 family endonuclease